eukprot:2524727-Pleurochrysis_carterae.AAC.2
MSLIHEFTQGAPSAPYGLISIECTASSVYNNQRGQILPSKGRKGNEKVITNARGPCADCTWMYAVVLRAA